MSLVEELAVNFKSSEPSSFDVRPARSCLDDWFPPAECQAHVMEPGVSLNACNISSLSLSVGRKPSGE
jgi:hypothetical protein